MKTQHILSTIGVLVLALTLLLLTSNRAFAGAAITIINLDGPGEGLNDPTPAAPVGGNPGTTLGQQRLIAFTYAANIWGEALDSNVPIVIEAQFNTFVPNVIGSARSPYVMRDFTGAGFYPGVEFPATWYSSALADKRAGYDLNPGIADINATFSSSYTYYLGLDNNHGTQLDLVVLLEHEFAHALGFQHFVNITGSNLGGYTDVFSHHVLDNSTGLHWDEMTNQQRFASFVNWGNVVWDGANVTAGVPNVLSLGSPEVRITAPAQLAGIYEFGTAVFGPPLGTPITGNVVAGLDVDEDGAAATFTTTDGCSPLTNAAAVAGNIAIVSRGGCTFVIKVKNAQNAGATAVIVQNNLSGVTDMGGADPTIVIPAVCVSRDVGNAIRAQLPGVAASIGVNPTIRAGADPSGRARLYAPTLRQTDGPISHYDTIAFRNLLMEFNLSADLTHNIKAPDDLTLELLRDVGWFPDADLEGIADDVDCDPTSDLSATVVIGGIDTSVPNTLFNTGCTISDLIAQIASSSVNHGEFVSGVAHLTNELAMHGEITPSQKGTIQSAAARADVP